MDAAKAIRAAGGNMDHPNKSRILRPFRLTDGEKHDLIEFLKSLTDQELLHDPQWSDALDYRAGLCCERTAPITTEHGHRNSGHAQLPGIKRKTIQAGDCAGRCGASDRLIRKRAALAPRYFTLAAQTRGSERRRSETRLNYFFSASCLRAPPMISGIA
jgi:hypothetical protein